LFAVLYYVLYSKESPKLSKSMLPKYSAMGDNLRGLADIQKQLGKDIGDTELFRLINNNEDNEDWSNIRRKYNEILEQEE